jgi:hypothetical protein
MILLPYFGSGSLQMHGLIESPSPRLDSIHPAVASKSLSVELYSTV